MVLHCFDSVTVEAVPAAAVVLAYVDGDYITYPQLYEKFRKATTLVVGVTTGTMQADVIDCENGDATPDTAAKWAVERLSEGHHPTVYGSMSTLEAVISNVRRRHVQADLVSYFLADWNQVGTVFPNLTWPRRIPSPYVGWQFAGNVRRGPHTIDASVVTRAWAERLGWTGNPGRRLFKVTR
jgi:hypothetical protein